MEQNKKKNTLKNWKKEVENMNVDLYNWGVNKNKYIKIGRYIVIGIVMIIFLWWRTTW